MCTFLVFVNYTSGYLKFCKYFYIFEMAWSGLFKNVNFIFLDIFLQTFLLYNSVLTLGIQIQSNFLLTPGLHTFMISSDLFNHHINITNILSI